MGNAPKIDAGGHLVKGSTQTTTPATTSTSSADQAGKRPPQNRKPRKRK